MTNIYTQTKKVFNVSNLSKMSVMSLLTLLLVFTSIFDTNGQATITTYSVSRLTRSYDTSYSVSAYCVAAGALTSGSTDDGRWVINLPFNFNFNGSVYSKVTMCTNGWLGLGDNSSTSFTASNGFSTTAPNNIIMPYFRDNNANFGVSITATGNAGNAAAGMRYGNGDSTGVFVAEWRNVASNGS
ncbi:MAG: hypothetical protein HYZ42_14510 [Bacteroidetes bacterium]|nr:hypothetical protein [Bacteroidota bacterium]